MVDAVQDEEQEIISNVNGKRYSILLSACAQSTYQTNELSPWPILQTGDLNASTTSTNAEANGHVDDFIDEEYGEPPTFTHPDSLSRLIAKPSGNMVRLPCAARGKYEMAFEMFAKPIHIRAFFRNSQAKYHMDQGQWSY